MRVSGFFLAIFGALIAIGRLFEVLQYPDHQLYIQLGLLGGAAALTIAGLLMLMEAYAMDRTNESEDAGTAGRPGPPHRPGGEQSGGDVTRW